MEQNTLAKLESEYTAEKITKATYIERTYEVHQTLFFYSDHIRSRNVKEIAITADGVVVTTKDGIKLHCTPGDWRDIPVEILNFGDFEPSETRVLGSFVSEDSVIVDIGANVGWYSIQFARRAHRGRVIAFEPIPATIASLRKNLTLNSVTNVTIFEHGLSDTDDEIVFHIQPHLSGATSARNLFGGHEAIETRAHVRRMDDVLAGEPRIDLIKCDVEGGELLVLRGGLDTIRRTQPVIFLEMLRKWSAKFGYHPNNIIDLLADFGYECFAVRGGGELERFGRMDENTAETNFVFLHRRKHAELLPGSGVFHNTRGG